MDRDKIIELLENEEYEAIQEILKKENANDPWVKLTYGYLYEQEGFAEFSLIKAKKYYSEGVNLEETIPHLYSNLARLQTEKNEKIKLLNDGISHHPTSELLAISLLEISDYKEYDNILKNNIDFDKLKTHERIIPLLLIKYYENYDYSNILSLDKNYSLEEYKFGDEFVLSCICAYAYYECQQYKDAITIFKHIKKFDVKNETNYFSLIGIILSYYRLDLFDSVKVSIEKLPFEISDYCYETG